MRKLLYLVVAATVLVLTSKPTLAAGGFDQFGYNYQARLFQGLADGVDKNLDGTVWGDPTYAKDHLVMKWSKAWDEARFNGAPWTPDAWEDNEWNGMRPDGSKTTEHVKIVWVGPQVWDVTGSYVMDAVYLGSHYGYSLTLSQSGNTVTGNLHDPYLPGDLAVTGTLTGNTLVFSVDYGTASVQGVRTFTGTLNSSGAFTGTWQETGTENGSGSWSTTSGQALLAEGPNWRQGGYRIWGDFEAIMDHGMVNGEHTWWAHAMPTGYGSN